MRRGYVMIYMPEHPRADGKGYVPEHQLVAERAAGRLLQPGEVVHHVNRITDDNRPENLEILSASEHRVRHSADQSAVMRRFHAENPGFASEIGRKGAKSRWGER